MEEFMTPKAVSGNAPLLQARNNLIVHQALCAAAKLGIADLIEGGLHATAELASELEVNEDALYRVLRALASQGVFEETTWRRFKNSQLSHFLRSDVPGSLRPLIIFWGTDFYYRALGEILYSVETGKPGRAKLLGMSEWEYMRQNPEVARIFDDAMTSHSEVIAPTIAVAYDFGAWGSIMDVGGGNGILLSYILKAHRNLRGVLADQPHVVERARQRGLLAGELAARVSIEECDFFSEVPSGCRAYLMKSVIHDWDDEMARKILITCRRAVPSNGALLLVEWALSEPNLPSTGKLMDIVMLALTGGKERAVEEYRDLLASAGFRLQNMITTPTEYAIIEAVPV
jgi:hypothetical protein